MKTYYDVLVVGLGAMGSAAIYQLSKRGIKVAGVDQYQPPHSYGSSHGETRITRLAVGEEEGYVPLVQESHSIWKLLEEETAQELFNRCGGYVIGNQHTKMFFHGTDNFIQYAVELAEKYQIKHQLHSSSEIQHVIPFLQLSKDNIGFYEPDAGLLYPEKIITSFLNLAEKNGASLFFHEKVLKYAMVDNYVLITTNQRVFKVGKVVFTAGPWIKDFLPNVYKNKVKVYKQEIFWFRPIDLKKIHATVFPWIIWIGKELTDFCTFFPVLDHGTKGMKFVTEQYIDECHPDMVDRTVSDKKVNAVYQRYIKHKIEGVTNECIKKDVCFYTVTPDANFIIDFHPDSTSILFVSSCSGHGFKHAAGIGRLITEKIMGAPTFVDDSLFTF